MTMSIVETFHGYIETTQDTLLIFEACRRGLLPRICRRLQEKERRIVQSGTVFVFDERESGIKRWTDGLVWSPSRILGNFLVYRELDKRNASGKKDASPIDRASRSSSSDVESAIEKNKERALVGSLTNSYRFKKNGLVKKTMSIVVNGVSQHLISYYSKDDVLAGKLRTPSSVPEFAGLEISPEFLMKQNFRIPPTVEQYDLGDHLQSPGSSNHSPRTPNGPFHTMGANGADFTSAGFSNHIRPKQESDLVGAPSPLDVFSKPYHHHQQQQSHHHMHTQQGYHNGLQHLGQHHHNPPYSPQHSSFQQNFTYGQVSNGHGGMAQDQTSTTPPPVRYMPRSQPFMPYPPTSQGQSPQSSQQRHSISPGGQYAGSPAMMMPSPGPNGTPTHQISTHDFSNLSTMGYQSPAPTSPGTFGNISNGSPQSNHSQQLHHHGLPPVTQGWSEYAPYPYPAPVSDHHSQHDHDSSSP
ncbi:Gti1/Pac2 family transcription factor [Entomortierella parvispora]|uniref:Gti1/Pac2 family transcription factor n=1 Tax=Entomortierella parvispora TaxID=205924 RepID=A0A9P3LYD0_9FUNG|nr:Gti1/Pac2 family transcription factor [Entomortierella parvispora]